jgi:hypothetical protein
MSEDVSLTTPAAGPSIRRVEKRFAAVCPRRRLYAAHVARVRRSIRCFEVPTGNPGLLKVPFSLV